MAKKRKPKGTRSLRGVKNLGQLCDLGRDHLDYRDWSIMTDSNRVWISKQKLGEDRTDHIDVPKAIFDKLFDFYGKQMPLGDWRGDRFYVRR